ncbi:PAS domain S-box protein, partial [Escherichia coli]
MGSCAAPSAKGDDKFITTDYLQQCPYVNPDFIKISGFTEEELLGQPHNIVRHPDMPPAAFEHMWST